jgi:tetratricopeptide (TPR) repeat protein/predicted Ser/Thr protein kinase
MGKGPGGGDPLEAERLRREVRSKLFGAPDEPVRIGRFVAVRRIGAGSMGVVHLAWDPELDRKVALKLLHRGDDERLLREAQAIARLRHPHVVAVHEVGTFEGQVFVAMEYVDGPTLGAWLAAAPRTPREIARVLAQAARALAAAHRAGVVHRDVKPDNILIGADGDARVVDFGLARAEAGAPPAGEGGEGAAASRSGSLAGTPAYMAPEIFAGAAADARSDQFSFCVTLWEALGGARPFAGDRPDEIARNAQAGRISEPPRRAPAWLRRVAARGLAVDPAARFPSMDDVAAALERDPARARARWLGGGAAAAALAALGVVALRPAPAAAPMCQDADASLAGVWDDGRRAAVDEAFRKTGVPYERRSWERVKDRLDAYARAWAEMHGEACRATRVSGAQSERVLELRMACLDRRLVELDALAALFAAADREVVEKSIDAAEGLTPVAACADVVALEQGVQLPDDPRVRERVLAVRADLARINALLVAGKYHEALPGARAAADAAAEIGWRPLRAEALERLGDAQWRSGAPKDGDATLVEALWQAEAGRHDEVAAYALLRLVLVAADLGKFDEGLAYGRRGEAAIERLGGNPRMRIKLLRAIAGVLRQAGRLKESLERLEESRRIAEEIYPEGDMERVRSVRAAIVVSMMLDPSDETIAEYRELAATVEAAVGPDHPELAGTLGSLAIALKDRGMLEEALAMSLRVIAIQERALDPGAPSLSNAYNNAANVYTSLQRPDEARALHEKALAIRMKTLGPEHASTAQSMNNLGNLEMGARRWAEARRWHEQALAIRLKALGPAHKDTGMSYTNLGDLEHQEGRYRESVVRYLQAIEVFEQALGKEHAWLGFPLTGAARSYLALRQPAKALAAAERALAIRERAKVQAWPLAQTRFIVAQALRASRRDPARARALALAARETLAAEARADELAAVDAFLR